ncbi:MAG: hypothetical protein SVS15_02250 [Thermodesulfobacteriota bacterium]|nr:hypothetical protein [Thermodesulfobacteriota bacterium]
MDEKEHPEETENAKPAEGQAPEGEAPGGPEHAKPEKKIRGLFSTQTIKKVGSGTTTRKTIKKTFWFAEELEDGSIETQPLNINHIPSGAKQKIPKNEFLDKFSPEPEFYVSTVYPKIQEMNRTVAKGEKHREKGETFSAELEFNHALDFDEDNVRANFGLGLTYMDRGDDKKANDIFQRVVKLDAAFAPEHKHLFNDFGINLRKNKMMDQSIKYYNRAIELTSNDENLHYNIARAYFDKQDMQKTAEHLDMAVKLNPEFEEGKKFLKYMKDKGLKA